MYGRNEFDFHLDDDDLGEACRIEDLIGQIADEVYDDIKRLGVMTTVVRVFTKYPRFSSKQATLLEEITEWATEHKQLDTAELIDAMFNESKREKMLTEFCFDYAERSVNKGFD